MERIKVKNNKAFLSFNEDIYDRTCIDDAAVEFADVCDVSFEQDLIALQPKDKEEPKILGLEFYNYVLGLMKNR